VGVWRIFCFLDFSAFIFYSAALHVEMALAVRVVAHEPQKPSPRYPFALLAPAGGSSCQLVVSELASGSAATRDVLLSYSVVEAPEASDRLGALRPSAALPFQLEPSDRCQLSGNMRPSSLAPSLFLLVFEENPQRWLMCGGGLARRWGLGLPLAVHPVQLSPGAPAIQRNHAAASTLHRSAPGG
jgi:hypothetical protein